MKNPAVLLSLFLTFLLSYSTVLGQDEENFGCMVLDTNITYNPGPAGNQRLMPGNGSEGMTLLPAVIPPCGSMACDDPVWRDGQDGVTSGPVRQVSVMIALVRDNNGNCPVRISDIEQMAQNAKDAFRGVMAADFATQNGFNWPSYDTKIELCFEIMTVDNSLLLTAHPFNVVNGFGNTGNGRLLVVVNEGSTFPNGSFGNCAWLRYADVFPKKTLAHELGHVLGLYHTFHGLNNQAGCQMCEENRSMSMSDRDKVNDFCSDTDPDPSTWGPNCTNTTPSDCAGMPLTLSTRFNLMSYASNGSSCASVLFTEQQANRMRCNMAAVLTNLRAYTDQNGCPIWALADFYATPTRACIGQPIYFFEDAATNSPTGLSYLWSFGDGSTSTLANPSHVYTQDGLYSVTLTVTTSNGVQHSYTRNQYIGIGMQSVPYVQGFNGPVEEDLPVLWERRNTSTPFATFQRITDFVYTPNTNPLPSARAWRILVGGGQPFWVATTLAMVGPSQVPAGQRDGAIAINNTIRTTGSNYCPNGAASAGEQDTLVTPVFDLSGLANPTMSFSWAHIPAANSTATTCGWTYPGFPSPINAPGNAYGSSISGCGPASNGVYPVCVDNKISVLASTDCGSTWVPLTDGASRTWNNYPCYNLNTVPGACCPYGFIPRHTNNWDTTSFNLCGVATAASVRFMFVYEHSGNNNYFWIDDFKVEGAPGAAWTANVTTTDESCGGILGTLDVATSPATYVDIDLMGQNGLVSNSSGTSANFTNLNGTIAGERYDVIIRDTLGNCVRQSRDIYEVSALTVNTTVVHACPSFTGSVTATVANPNPGSTYNYEFKNIWTGQVLHVTNQGPSYAYTVNSGNYSVFVTENGSGLCGFATDSVGNTGNLNPQFTLSYDCNTYTGTLTVSAPLGAGLTYTLLTDTRAQVGASSTSGVLNIPGPGHYILQVNGPSDCGEVKVDASDFAPGFSVAWTDLPSSTCGATGALMVTATPAGNNYQYTLYNMSGNAIATSTNGVFQGLAAGNYGVQVTRNGNVVECERHAVSIGTFFPTGVQLQVVAPNSDCQVPNGSISFTTPWNAYSTLQATVINTTTQTTIFSGAAYPGIGNCQFSSYNGNVIYANCNYMVDSLAGGTYEIQLTYNLYGQQNCTTLVVTVPDYNAPLSMTSTVTNACMGTGGAIDLNVVLPTPGETFSCTVKDSNGVVVYNAFNLGGLIHAPVPGPGAYNLFVMASSGVACGSANVTVANTGNLQPQVQVLYNCDTNGGEIVLLNPTGPGVNCNLILNGAVVASASNGTLPFAQPGIYTVEVYTATDCGYLTVDATDFSPSFSMWTNTTPSASCGTTGTISVGVSDSTASYLYTLSQGQTFSTTNGNGTFTALAAGTYTLGVQYLGTNIECELTTVTIAADTVGCCVVPGVAYTYYNATTADLLANFPNGIITQNITLNGTTNLTQPFIIAGATVHMGQHARIDLMPGATLTILKGGKIIAGCDENWDGIYCTTPGAVIFTNRSDILGYQNGIVVLAAFNRMMDSGAEAAGELAGTVWPNPTNGNVSLAFDRPVGEMQLRVFNASGVLFLARTQSFDGDPIGIDLHNAPQGIYHVSAELANGQRFSARVVLQK